MRERAPRLAPLQNTPSPYHLPEIGKTIAYQANREGVAERFAEPSVRKRIEVDLALIDPYDPLLTDLELSIPHTAQAHDAHTFYRLRSVPGIGKILALLRLYDIDDIPRFPRGQDFVSDCRLVKGAQASAGKRYGTRGKTIGNAPLQGAFSKAAVLFLRNHPAGLTYFARLERQHGKGKALPGLAPQLARAVYYLLKRETAFDRHPCLAG
jgi:transposase